MSHKTLPFVLSDCDGTICGTDLLIAPETMKDILTYQDKSHHRFSFVTGRLGVSSRLLARDLKITLPVISCNGALISDLKTNEILYVKYLDKRIVLKILATSVENGVQPFIYSTHQMAGLIANPRLELWRQFASKLKKKYRWPIMEYATLEDLQNAILEDVIRPVQIILYAPTVEQQKAAQAIIKNYEFQISGFQSLSTIFNITAKEANKLTGLQAWADLVATDYKEIVVFGDNFNDQPMLQGVNFGVAVGNAVPELKAIAKRVVAPMYENGVGQELQRILKEK